MKQNYQKEIKDKLDQLLKETETKQQTLETKIQNLQTELVVVATIVNAIKEKLNAKPI